MGDAKSEGTRAAADALAKVMRVVAGVKTRQTATDVNTRWDGEDILVQAGKPEGTYGWTPIQALMFDNNKRHPLFGNRQHWYHEGYWPITELTVRQGATYAAEAFADVYVDAVLKEHGII